MRCSNTMVCKFLLIDFFSPTIFPSLVIHIFLYVFYIYNYFYFYPGWFQRSDSQHVCIPASSRWGVAGRWTRWLEVALSPAASPPAMQLHTRDHRTSLLLGEAGHVPVRAWCVQEMMERREAPALEPFSFPGSVNRWEMSPFQQGPQNEIVINEQNGVG